MRAVNKNGTNGTALANTDCLVYTVSQGLTGGIGGSRKLTTSYIVIAETGGAGGNVTIWDGPSATGVIVLGPLAIAANQVLVLGPGFGIDFRTSVVFQVSAATQTDVAIVGDEI